MEGTAWRSPKPARTPSTWSTARAPGPLTQHGAEGPSASGRPVHRPNPRPVDAEALRPLRLLVAMQPFGFPIQFWIGAAAMAVIAALMFL